MTTTSTGAGALEPVHEAVVRQALDEADLPGQQREVVTDVLIDRMRRNAGTSTRTADEKALSAAVDTILGELARSTARVDYVDEPRLSADQVNSLIDSVCRRYHLPWPICPADD